jgi:hypothetical protein
MECPICAKDMAECGHFSSSFTEKKMVSPAVEKELLVEFLERSEHAIKEFGRWESSLRSLTELCDCESGVLNARQTAFLKDVEQMVVADRELLGRVRTLMSKMEVLAKGKIESRVYKIFKAVFRNMSSRTKPLIHVKTGNWRHEADIVVGTFGFGLRHHKQARGVKSFSDVKIVYDNREAVCAALKADAALERVWRRVFERFMLLLPDLSFIKREPVAIPAMRRMIMPKNLRGYRTDLSQAPKVIVKITFNNQQNDIMSVDTGGEVHSIGMSRMGFEDAILYAQLHPDMTAYVDALEAICLPSLEKGAVVIDALEKEFSRQILIHDV